MTNVIVLGAGGFLGRNLCTKLVEDQDIQLTAVECNSNLLKALRKKMGESRVCYIEQPVCVDTDFVELLQGQNIVYHFISTTNPTTANKNLMMEIQENVMMTARMLEQCVEEGVERVVFLSSGGTVYGQYQGSPFRETDDVNPINSYGLHKVMIEKMLYYYYYTKGLDYRVIRLANPYGPYQDYTGKQGVIMHFIYRALTNQKLTVYGNGEITRDYMYIDDVIKGILRITNATAQQKLYNLGSGKGYSLTELIHVIEQVTKRSIEVETIPRRSVDVNKNVLDTSRYYSEFRNVEEHNLNTGIEKCVAYIENEILSEG